LRVSQVFAFMLLVFASIACSRQPAITPGVTPRATASNTTADWAGKTGLDAETEAHVPEYVRLEFGESESDPESLKASNLKYIGMFKEGADKFYYWQIPTGQPGAVFVYVRVSPNGDQFTGLGDRRPPMGGGSDS
jgi:hypothetical protein